MAADPDYRPRRTYFTSADGMAGVPYSEGSTASVRAADGRLWFVTSTGVTVVNPDDIGGLRGSPSPAIEAVAADSVPQRLSDRLDLPSRTAHVQIAFGAPAVTDSHRVRFRYLLEGLDRNWVDAGRARVVNYAHLPPRTYRFRVAATDGDEVWSQDAVLTFAVAPAFVQTRMFYAACAGAAALLVLGAWRLHVRRVRREFAMVLAERVRLGRALHDTLLQGLAGMALQVDDVSHRIDLAPAVAKERLTRVRWQVEDHIRRARHSIWGLRSPILESNDMSRALRRAAEEAVAGRSVELTVSAKGVPPARHADDGRESGVHRAGGGQQRGATRAAEPGDGDARLSARRHSPGRRRRRLRVRHAGRSPRALRPDRHARALGAPARALHHRLGARPRHPDRDGRADLDDAQ